MEEKIRKLQKILKEQNQEQLLEYPINYKEELIDQLCNIHYEQLNQLYQKAIKKEEKAESKIEPISSIEKDKLSKEERKHYETIGENIIKEGKYAVVTMAGGQRNKTWT